MTAEKKPGDWWDPPKNMKDVLFSGDWALNEDRANAMLARLNAMHNLGGQQPAGQQQTFDRYAPQPQLPKAGPAY
jgi:hypothetical protein